MSNAIRNTRNTNFGRLGHIKIDKKLFLATVSSKVNNKKIANKCLQFLNPFLITI